MFDTPFWAGLWNPIYTLFFLLLIIFYSIIILGKDANSVLYGRNTSIVGLTLLCVLTSVYIGCRPIVWGAFADSWGYYHSFENLASKPLSLELAYEMANDGLFYYIEVLCTRFTTATGWFIIMALCYYMSTLRAARRLFANNSYSAMLTLFFSLSTF